MHVYPSLHHVHFRAVCHGCHHLSRGWLSTLLRPEKWIKMFIKRHTVKLCLGTFHNPQVNLLKASQYSRTCVLCLGLQHLIFCLSSNKSLTALSMSVEKGQKQLTAMQQKTRRYIFHFSSDNLCVFLNKR